MFTTTVRLLTALAVVTLVSLVSARATEASLIKIDFTGTYNTGPETIFGQHGSAVPFAYSITYDTALASTPLFIKAGTVIGGFTYAEDFYGYSQAGITASSLTFGTHTFPLSSLVASGSDDAHTADLWFNTNLAIAAPTKVSAIFRDGQDSLLLGGMSYFAEGIGFDTLSFVETDGSFITASGKLTLAATPVSQPVPEPASMLLLGTGLLGLAARVRRTHGHR